MVSNGEELIIIILSIIIPIYKTREKYFIECLESLPHNSDFEIILVFDGAHKRLEDIARNLKRKNENINIFKIEHSGVSSARNYGIKKSKGSYITFVDSDDFLDSQFETEILNNIALDNSNFDLHLYNIYRYKDKTQEVFENNFVKRNIISENENLIYDLKKQLIHKNFSIFKPRYNSIAVVVGKIYKRNFLLENEIEFDINLKYSEDAIFFYEILNLEPRINIIEMNLYYYRISNFQTTTKYTSNLEMEYLNAIKAYEKLIIPDKKSEFLLEILTYRKLINIFSLLRNETLNKSVYKGFWNIRKLLKNINNETDYKDVTRLQIAHIFKRASIFYAVVMFFNKINMYTAASLLVFIKFKFIK